MDIVRSFIHTNRDLHGKDCVSEFLLPNIGDNKPEFIGLVSGKSYKSGLIVGTSKKWNSDILFKEFKKVKNIGLFGRKEKKEILKKYINQISSMHEDYPDSIVALDSTLSLVKLESRTEFLHRTKPKPKQLPQEVSDNYLKLAKICLSESDFLKFESFTRSLKDYNGHWKYQTTLNFIFEFLHREKIYFFLALDWKAGIPDLNWVLNTAFEKNFSQNVELPSANDYPERASVSFDNVFCDYIKALNKSNFDLSIIDTNSDQYVLLLHKLSEKEAVRRSINGIKYNEMKLNCT